MGRAFRGQLGGIVGLLILPTDDWEAIESALLFRGFTLADIPGKITWRAVKAMLRKPWQPTDHLLAHLGDIAAWLKWSKTEDGQRNINHPEPIRRPGDDERRAAWVEETLAAAQAAGYLPAQRGDE